MAQIGSFTRDKAGIYTGEIHTLFLRVGATICPCERDHDRSPDHRVIVDDREIGAAWSKSVPATRTEYLSLKLDDPFFPAPVYATLVQGDAGDHKLIWSR